MDSSHDSPVRIICIEDNPADVALLRLALDEHIGRYEMSVLSDGQKAMQYLAGDDAPPDLFVLDLNLPYHNGLDVLEQIKRSPRWADSPVAILTTSETKQERESSLRLGAECFLHKPNSLDDFLMLGAELKRCSRASL